MADFNGILQLDFTNLSGGEFQLPTTTDGLGFLQFLDLGIANRNGDILSPLLHRLAYACSPSNEDSDPPEQW